MKSPQLHNRPYNRLREVRLFTLVPLSFSPSLNSTFVDGCNNECIRMLTILIKPHGRGRYAADRSRGVSSKEDVCMTRSHKHLSSNLQVKQLQVVHSGPRAPPQTAHSRIYRLELHFFPSSQVPHPKLFLSSVDSAELPLHLKTPTMFSSPKIFALYAVAMAVSNYDAHAEKAVAETFGLIGGHGLGVAVPGVASVGVGAPGYVGVNGLGVGVGLNGPGVGVGLGGYPGGVGVGLNGVGTGVGVGADVGVGGYPGGVVYPDTVDVTGNPAVGAHDVNVRTSGGNGDSSKTVTVTNGDGTSTGTASTGTGAGGASASASASATASANANAGAKTGTSDTSQKVYRKLRSEK